MLLSCYCKICTHPNDADLIYQSNFGVTWRLGLVYCLIGVNIFGSVYFLNYCRCSEALAPLYIVVCSIWNAYGMPHWLHVWSLTLGVAVSAAMKGSVLLLSCRAHSDWSWWRRAEDRLWCESPNLCWLRPKHSLLEYPLYRCWALGPSSCETYMCWG